MFRIEFFVKDGKLAQMLRLLDGKAYELRAVPVADDLGGSAKRQPKPKPTPTKTKKKKQPLSTGTKAAMIRETVAGMDGNFSLREIVKATGERGENVRSAILPLLEAGSLKKVERGIYTNARAN